MCRIIVPAGNVSPRNQLDSTLSCLAHRGPDSDGMRLPPPGYAWFGHRRRSIMDLSIVGRRPMHNEDYTLWLVCNHQKCSRPTISWQKATRRSVHCRDWRREVSRYQVTGPLVWGRNQ